MAKLSILLFSIAISANYTNATLFGLQSSDNRLSVFTSRTAAPGWPLFFTVKPNIAVSGWDLPRNFTWDFYKTILDNNTLATQLIDGNCIGENGTVLSRCQGPVIAKCFPAEGKYLVRLQYLINNGSLMQSFYMTVNLKTTASRSNVTRKEFRKLSQSEWANFRDALYTLKNYGVYDLLVAIHGESMNIVYDTDRPETNISHGSPAFLPWHRLFLKILENALQAYSNIDDLAIPFWDWTLDAEMADPKLAPLWTDQYLGPGGDIYTGEVLSGPFCSRKTSNCTGRWPIIHDGPYLKRQLGYLFPALPSKNTVSEILDQEVYDEPPFNNASAGFRPALEGWSGLGHNSVHLFVGGSMISGNSPNDPVFLLHHAFIDQLWEHWKREKQCQSDQCYAPVDGSADLKGGDVPAATQTSSGWRYFGQQWSDKMWPWDVRVRDIAGFSTELGYRYQWDGPRKSFFGHHYWQ